MSFLPKPTLHFHHRGLLHRYIKKRKNKKNGSLYERLVPYLWKALWLCLWHVFDGIPSINKPSIGCDTYSDVCVHDYISFEFRQEDRHTTFDIFAIIAWAKFTLLNGCYVFLENSEKSCFKDFRMGTVVFFLI